MNETEKIKWGAAKDTTFNGGGDEFLAMKVPRHCPLVLLVKVD
jgi:hypothetical protein